MHSSRLRTVCCSAPRGCASSFGGGVCFLFLGGSCFLLLGGVLPASGDVLPASGWGGGGVCLGEGLSTQGGVSQHALRQTPLWMTDRRLWKYYLAATSLRTVNIYVSISWVPRSYLQCLIFMISLSHENLTSHALPINWFSVFVFIFLVRCKWRGLLMYKLNFNTNKKAFQLDADRMLANCIRFIWTSLKVFWEWSPMSGMEGTKANGWSLYSEARVSGIGTGGRSNWMVR